jgi:hypothetical protein
MPEGHWYLLMKPSRKSEMNLDLNKKRTFVAETAVGIAILLAASSAHALELDWSGKFRTEFHFVKNYTMDGSASGSTVDSSRITSGPNFPNGYYIPGGGNTNATFETLFLKLQPKAIVNDNITIKSEFWAGNPAYGLFGDSYPQSFDQRQYYSTQSRGAFFSAQRLWGEFTTDFGVITLGRAPLNWGLGVFWSAGENLWDRYESTGDQIRLTSKFGSFSLSPGVAIYSTGNSVGGTCSFTGGSGANLCTTGQGSGAVSDYFIQLKYENLEEDFEGGVNFVRRIAGGSQDNYTGTPTAANPGMGPINPNGIASSTTPFPSAAGLSYNTWDLYAQKKIGKWRLAAEVPITSGKVGGVDYSSVSVAAEADWRINDPWEMQLRGGRAPGQPGISGTTPDKFKTYFFNPNYHVGTILFNYNLLNMSGYLGPNTLNNPAANQSNLRSPFDNPITNATYISWTGLLHADKWTFNTGFLWAKANTTAKASDAYFFNTYKRQYEARNATYTKDQGSNLGFEWDTGAAFQWDEYFLFRLDLGLLFPGDYFKYSNSPNGNDNATDTVFAAVFRVGVNF